MIVIFKFDQFKILKENLINCKVIKIMFDKFQDKVFDWDDRIRTVKWIDIFIFLQFLSEGQVENGINYKFFNVRFKNSNIILIISWKDIILFFFVLLQRG